MSKKEISWIGLINAKIAERKKKGKSAGVKDVMGEAKSEWVTIKNGKHDKYIQGKSKVTRKKGKKGKKCKTSKSKQDIHLSATHILNKCELCTDCMKEIKDCIKNHK